MPISTINNKSIADGTVIAADILDGTISSSKLVSANIAGDRIAANTLSNTVFQTGSVESYLRGANLDFGMRNRIINGAMVIDQRAAGAAVTPSSDDTFTLDRWSARLSQSSKFTVQKDSSANTVAGFTSSLKVTSLSSYSATSTDYFAITQGIEGFNTADLAFGTASAKPITLSFWVRSSLTGTFSGALLNDTRDRVYPFTYTINSANTWEYETITIAGDTEGVWTKNNSAGIYVRFSLGAGSTRLATAGSWQNTAGAIFGATGSVSVVGTNAATWYVTGVQLEEGSVPTPFEYRQFGDELSLCQRYFETSYPIGVALGTNGYVGPAAVTARLTQQGYCIFTVPYTVQKRAAPSIGLWSFNGTSNQLGSFDAGTNLGACSALQINSNSFLLCNNSGGNLADASPVTINYSASSEL